MPAVNNTPRVVRAYGDKKRLNTSYGWFSFRLTGEQVPWRGQLAYEMLVYESVDPDVLRLSRSECRLRWYDGREWRVHRPQFTVERNSRVRGETRTTEIEIVRSSTLRDPALADTYARIEFWAADQGIDYRLRTEKHLVQPRLDNAFVVMNQAGDGIVPAEDALYLDKFLLRIETFTLADIVAAGVLDRDRAYTAVLNRVACGDLAVDLGVPFGDSSIVTRRRSRA